MDFNENFKINTQFVSVINYIVSNPHKGIDRTKENRI